MKRLLLSLLYASAVFAQSGGQPVVILVPDTPSMLLTGVPFTKDLGITAASLQSVSRDGIYHLRFHLQNVFGVYPGYYETKIYLGSNELCSTDGWATQRWLEITLVCPSPGYLVFDQWPDWTGNTFDPNAHLKVSLSITGWQIYLSKDNVSLTFTPSN